MKYICLTKIALVVLLTLSLFSCSDKNKSKSQENQDTDSANLESVEELYTIEEIFEKLDKATFPQTWDEDYLESRSYQNTISVTPENINKMNLLNDGFDGSEATFIWKYETPDWNMICLEAFYIDENYYYLITVEKNFQKIDELQFAGTRSIRVENPYGGTSAGIEHETAVLENASGPIYSESDKYSVNSEGHFFKEIDIIKPIPLSEFKTLFKEETSFPFNVDSALVFGINDKKYKGLNAGQVMTLFANGKNIADLYGSSHVKAFIQIDSMKQAGTYDKFLQGENSGKIVWSQAYAIHKLILDNNNRAYIWSIYDATAEIGPHSSGSLVFISFVNDEKVLSSYPISKFSSGGDAPVWDEHKISANISKTADIKITSLYIFGDGELGEEEITKNNFTFQFQNGKLTELKEKE